MDGDGFGFGSKKAYLFKEAKKVYQSFQSHFHFNRHEQKAIEDNLKLYCLPVLEVT